MAFQDIIKMNSVSRLNEISQQSARPYPKYDFSFENQMYVCTCHFQGKYITGISAKNKKLAKENAATAALETITDVMIVGFDPSPLWNGALEVSLTLKKNGEEKRFVLHV